MKLRLVVIGAGIALLAVGLALTNSDWGRSAGRGIPAQVLSMALEHEDVPLYPGADKVEVEYGRPWRYTTYEVVALPEKLLAFYKEQMPTKDWVFQWENHWSNGEDTMVFYTWENPGGTLPWSLDVSR